MQLEDSGFENLNSIFISSDIAEVFKEADFVVFLGGRPREPGMERSDLL